MNAWSEIVDMLTENKRLREMIVAPNAPPVSPRSEGRKVIGARVFSPADVTEALEGASAHASGQQETGDLGLAGVVCLGVKDVGRIRISYFTQRGSRALRIVRVPFEVPTIDEICAKPAQVRELAQAIGSRRYKVILINGPAHLSNSQLSYAIMGELNKTHREVIYVAERMLSFLLAHDNSIVVQVEVPTDAPSLEAAIQQAILLEPDVVHLGNITVTDNMPSLSQLIHADTCTILSTVSDDPLLLLDRLPEALHRRVVAQDTGMVVSVQPVADGKIQIVNQPWPSMTTRM